MERVIINDTNQDKTILPFSGLEEEKMDEGQRQMGGLRGNRVEGREKVDID